jgi:hypothetical protein
MKWYLASICTITFGCAFYLAYLDEIVSILLMCSSLMLIDYTVLIFSEDKLKWKGSW